MSSAAPTDCVKVAVRVRPFVPNETNRGCIQIIDKTPGIPQLTVTGESHSKIPDYYTFNNVFMPEETQEDVYVNSVKPIIGKLFEGYNVTILAYGQTGSGKTYTMGTCFEGNWDNPKTGIIPRALQDIFLGVREREAEASVVTVTCSFMELYQENLYDLLSGKIKEQSSCDIREARVGGGIEVSGLTEQTIDDASKAAKYLMEGGENRSVGATAMNDVSSRSHAVFTVNVKVVTGEGSTTKAKFHLVDLAGSERSKKTKATGMRFKEGVKINQGLLALGNVISALGGGSGTTGGYISYRDSKLTRLLQDSLGGNSVTLMIACVSPADYNIEETLSTLRYADRAKKIKNKPIKNQDSHEAEVQRLKDMIQDLRVQLLESREPTNGNKRRISMSNACGAECKKMKMDKDNDNNLLRQQLSNIVSVVNSLHSKNLLQETFYTELIERFEKLRNLILRTCPVEFVVSDTNIFVEITAETQAIEALIRNFKLQLDASPNEDDYNIEENHFDDDASNQKLLEYTTTQIEALKQIKTLEREMKIKQDLLDRKFLNTPFLNDEAEKTIGEYQTTIKTLEKELDELRVSSNSGAARRDHNATKVNMDRKHKIEKLEKDLEETRKKCVTLEKTKKLAEQDRKRIEDLKKEILAMKTARIQLIRQQRSDSDRYKKWISSRDKEINTLKEKGKKVQNEMKRMERMHEKQQAVLKRKVEEAKAVNKRLQDAMDRNKKAQAMRISTKATEKTDVIQTYIDHELMVLMSTIDAKIAMQSLMNDRGLLNQRLLNLKSTVNKNDEIENEIKQLEEDLEMRNTQIADIRQKVMQTDLEAKMKSIPENFNSIPEQKIAMGYIIRALLDCREDFTTTKMKAEDLKSTYESSEDRIEQLNAELDNKMEEFEHQKAEIERDFETKLSFWCQNVKTKSSEQSGETVKVEENLSHPIYVSMCNQLCDTRTKNTELEQKVAVLQSELDRMRNAKKRKSIKRPQNETFDMNEESDSSVVESDSDEFDFNDSFHDPDWQKTPAQKRGTRASARTTTLLKESLVNRMDGTGLLANISETSDTSSRKRSSNGQMKCNCKGSCATKQCGCKKVGNYCAENCRCSTACLNKPDESKESDEAAGGDTFAIEKENGDGMDQTPPKHDRSKMDFNNITTPYYPYQTKKRKPLLQI